MITKKIVFTKAYTAELLDAECAPPKAQEVTVQLDYSAISAGTERANFVGLRNSIFTAEGEAATFPRSVGYSSAGTVLSVGEAGTDLHPGDRVLCFDSCHQKHQNLSRKNLVPLPEGVSTMEASMAYISIFPLNAIRKTKPELGESAMVMGLGILGIFAVQQLKAAGACPVIAVDPIASRRELALKLGADYALDPTAEDFVQQALGITGGGAKVCIEVTGLGIGLIQALDCMKRMGRIALLGCTRSSKFEIDYYSKVHGRGISLIGAHTMARPSIESYPGGWTAVDDLNAIVRLIAGKRLNFRDMVGEICSPADAQAVFTRLANDRNFPIGVLFDWSLI